MAKDPSLLPEDMRRVEEELTARAGAENGSGDFFHVPDRAVEEEPPRKRERRNGVRAGRNGAQEKPTPTEASAPAPKPVKEPQSPVAKRSRAKAPPQKEATPTPKRASVVLPKLHMPMGGLARIKGISLIPDEFRKKPVSPKWPQVVAIIGIALTVPLLGVPWWMLTTKLTTVRAETETIERQHSDLLGRIAVVERAVEGYRATARRATALRALLDQHSSWEPFFDLIESQTLPGMRYEVLVVDTSGSVSLSAVAPSLRIAAAQLVAWQEEERVNDISMSGFGSVADEQGIVRGTQFDLRLSVDPSVFTTSAAPPEAPQGE